MNRTELPYYFEIPELSMPPFDVTEYFVDEAEREIAKTDVKTADRLTGNSRSNTANWYQSFIKVEENSSQDKRDFKQVNLYEEANFDLTKNIKDSEIVLTTKPYILTIAPSMLYSFYSYDHNTIFQMFFKSDDNIKYYTFIKNKCYISNIEYLN